MKINHKPIRRAKGLGQRKIEQFKSKQEYGAEIKALEEQRYRHYLDFLKGLQLIDLEKKREADKKKTLDTRQSIIELYDGKKKHLIASYNEIVKPIDKKLHSLRIEVMQHFPYIKKDIDERI